MPITLFKLIGIYDGYDEPIASIRIDDKAGLYNQIGIKVLIAQTDNVQIKSELHKVYSLLKAVSERPEYSHSSHPSQQSLF